MPLFFSRFVKFWLAWLFLLPTAAAQISDSTTIARSLPGLDVGAGSRGKDWLARLDANLFEQCGSDPACATIYLRQVLEHYMTKNDFPAGIVVADRLIEVAQANEDWETLAEALNDQAGLFEFLNDIEKKRGVYFKLIDLYRKTGQLGAMYYRQVLALEMDGQYGPDTTRITNEMDSLLRLARAGGHHLAANKILSRLKYRFEELGQYGRLAMVVDTLETLAGTPVTDDAHNPYVFPALSGRGHLLQWQRDYRGASEQYRIALRHIRRTQGSYGGPWNQTYLLLKLANLEAELGTITAAGKYLDTAIVTATKYGYDDLLLESYGLEITLAERARDFEKALAGTRRQQNVRARIDSVKDDFDARRQNLQLLITDLKLGQENMSVALRLEKAQSRVYIILGLLVGLVALALLLGFTWQRRSKHRLTERTRIIHRQAEELKELDQAKSRFFANVSHELRTPLTLMLDPLSGLLRDGDSLNYQQRELLEIAARGGQDLERLVKQLLNLARLDANKLQPQFETTGVNNFFTGLVADFGVIAKRQGIDYRFQVLATDENAVLLDRELTRQILTNFLTNAFKFTPAGGAVSARIEYASGALRIVVADNGPGIPEENRDRIFERYFQRADPDAPVTGGTGIGLSLVREYVTLLGGTIGVEDTEGGGATFAATWPVHLADQKAAPVETSPAANDVLSARHRANLVIVEDHPDLRRYLVQILSGHYRVKDFPDGRAAWAFIESNPKACDLVLSDYMMPIMDGIQLLERVKSTDATASLPFILLTARATPSNRLRNLRVGVDDYITKPFKSAELLARVDGLLEHFYERRTVAQEDKSSALPQVQDQRVIEQDREWLLEFEDHLRARIGDRRLKVSGLAKRFAMSESTLLRQVKRLTGLTVQQYITELRISVARTLLEEGDLGGPAEIAEAVGYASLSSFNRRYRAVYGVLPSQELTDEVTQNPSNI